MVNRRAFNTLVTARFIYAINYYNIASLFSFIAIDFGQGVAGLGLVTAAFYIGIGTFQVPGGLIAAKIGPRRTTAYGTLFASLMALLSGFAANMPELAVMRFLVGVGMALVFSPGVALVAKYYRMGSEGLGIGFFSAAFNLGAAIGIFGWAVLATLIGWRIGFVGSGVLGIVSGALLLLFVPRDNSGAHFMIRFSDFRRVLVDLQLLTVSAVLLGLGIGNLLVSNFIVYYLENSQGLRPSMAATIGSLALLTPVPFSPIGGRVYDRVKNVKGSLLICGLVTAGAVAVAAFKNVYAAVISVIGCGIGSSIGFVICFTASREMNLGAKEYESLVVAYVNGIALIGSFWAPLAFSYLAEQFDYPVAWLAGSLFTFLLILPALALKNRQ